MNIKQINLLLNTIEVVKGYFPKESNAWNHLDKSMVEMTRDFIALQEQNPQSKTIPNVNLNFPGDVRYC